MKVILENPNALDIQEEQMVGITCTGGEIALKSYEKAVGNIAYLASQGVTVPTGPLDNLVKKDVTVLRQGSRQEITCPRLQMVDGEPRCKIPDILRYDKKEIPGHEPCWRCEGWTVVK